jgi:predicted secreted protein
MSGRDAFGTQLKLGDGGDPESFTTIANVTSIGGPSRSRETIDVTAHDSADQYMEFLGGLKDGGEVTADINYDPDQATSDLLEDEFEAEDPTNWQLVLLPGTESEHTWDISGILTELSDEFPHDDKMGRSITIKINGKPTLTQTGS